MEHTQLWSLTLPFEILLFLQRFGFSRWLTHLSKLVVEGGREGGREGSV